jgi:hypothetical protein
MAVDKQNRRAGPPVPDAKRNLTDINAIDPEAFKHAATLPAPRCRRF